MVVREPEWTDDDRRQMRELEVFESGVHRCGYHRSLLDDKSNVFMPEDWTCPVCRGAERYARMLRRSDDAYRDKNDPYAPDPKDGRSTVMRLLSPREAEEWRVRQASVAEQPPGQQH